LGFFSLFRIPTYTYASHKYLYASTYTSAHIVLQRLQRQHTYRNASTSPHNHVICARMYPGSGPVDAPVTLYKRFLPAITFVVRCRPTTTYYYYYYYYTKTIYTRIIYYRHSILSSVPPPPTPFATTPHKIGTVSVTVLHIIIIGLYETNVFRAVQFVLRETVGYTVPNDKLCGRGRSCTV